MSGRPSHRCALAVAYQQRTSCTPQEAAQRYGLAVSTVRRALARVPGYVAAPVGRPPSRDSFDA